MFAEVEDAPPADHQNRAWRNRTRRPRTPSLNDFEIDDHTSIFASEKTTASSNTNTNKQQRGACTERYSTNLRRLAIQLPASCSAVSPGNYLSLSTHTASILSRSTRGYLSAPAPAARGYPNTSIGALELNIVSGKAPAACLASTPRSYFLNIVQSIFR